MRLQLSLSPSMCLSIHTLFPPNKHFIYFTTFHLYMEIHCYTADGPGPSHWPLVSGSLMARIQCSLLWSDFNLWLGAENLLQVVVGHLEPDILEFKVKWALGSTVINKASGCNGIPVELYKTRKDDAIQVLHSTCQQIWKAQQWLQDWKRSVFIPVPKKGSTKKAF